MKGKIIAVPFPFTNLKGAKVRPALVIYEEREEVIVAFIDSVIQLNKLATLDKSLIEGEFGKRPDWAIVSVGLAFDQ